MVGGKAGTAEGNETQEAPVQQASPLIPANSPSIPTSSVGAPHGESVRRTGKDAVFQKSAEAQQPTRSQPGRSARFDGNWKDRLSARSAVITANAVKVFKEGQEDGQTGQVGQQDSAPIRPTIPLSYEEAVRSKYTEEWLKAMAEEIGSIEGSGTWTG
jgi:hypothetical protein